MKKTIGLVLLVSLLITLTACSSKKQEETTVQSGKATESEKTSEQIINVGATPAPHGEILEKAAEILKKQGITLKITEFTDYVLPNTALEGGDLDANFFQHQPYLDTFNQKNGTSIVGIAKVHFEPLGVFKGKCDSIEALKENATIAIPNDSSNGARALLLLDELGVIGLKKGAGVDATILDIKTNPKNIKFYEIEAAQLTRTLPDVDLAVINGNYAQQAGIFDKLLTSEQKDGQGAKTYANLLCVKKGNENNENIKKLAEVLNSEEIKKFIEEKYEGLFVTAF